jgi:hypothetical protein
VVVVGGGAIFGTLKWTVACADASAPGPEAAIAMRKSISWSFPQLVAPVISPVNGLSLNPSGKAGSAVNFFGLKNWIRGCSVYFFTTLNA